MGNGTLVLERGYLRGKQPSYGKWHRSKDKPHAFYLSFTSFMINKKWWLEEQFTVHVMRFQQVNSIAIGNLYILSFRLVL